MAKIKLGPLVDKVRGKLGTVVFSEGKTGSTYVKMLQTKTTNPASANQAAQRNIFTALTKQWNTLGADEQAAWNEYAKNGYGKRTIPTGGGAREIIHGNTGRGGGKGLFMYVNQNRLRIGQAVLTWPVPGKVIPDGFTTFTGVCAGGVITITTDGAADTNCAQIWIVGNGKIPHRQVAYDGLASAPTTFHEVNAAKGTPMELTKMVGEKVYLQGEVIDPTSGLASNPSETIELTIA